MIRLQWERPGPGRQAGSDWYRRKEKETQSLNCKDKSGMKAWATTGDSSCKVISCFYLHRMSPVNKRIQN